MIFLLWIALGATPGECEPPPLRDVAPLTKLATLDGQLAEQLEAIAAGCFDLAGAWNAGKKDQAQVDPDAPAVGACLQAIRSCERVSETLGTSAQLRKLQKAALLDLERPFHGARYQTKRLGLKGKPATQVLDCESKSRLDLDDMIRDRAVLERTAKIVQSEYADYKIWLLARELQCRKKLEALPTPADGGASPQPEAQPDAGPEATAARAPDPAVPPDAGVAAPAPPAARAQRAEPVGAIGMPILVDGTPLIGTRSFAERRGGSLFIPLMDLASRLSMAVTVDPVARLITVQRPTGISATWNARTGEVAEDRAVVLVATRLGEVLFGTGPEDVMLPAEIIAPLLDVSVIAGASDVQINTGRQHAKVGDRPNQLVELNRADYAYHLSVVELALNHSLQLHSAGRVQDGLFDLAANFSRAPGDSVGDFRYGRAAYESRDGFRLVLGDFNPGVDLEFLSSQLRGGAVSVPAAGGRAEIFSGLSRSDVIHLNTAGRQNFSFDTLVVGADFVRAYELGRYRLITNAGGLYLSGPDREGGLVTGRVGYRSDLNQAQVDLGLGAYRGLQANGTRVSGLAGVIDATDSFTPTRRLTLLARITHIGENFISPQQTGTLRPMNLFATGGYFRPFDWLATSLNGQLIYNPSFTAVMDASVTGTVSFDPGGDWPSALLSHSQGFHQGVGATAFTLIDVSKQFKRWGIEAIYARTATDRLPENNLFSLGGRVNFTDHVRLQALQSFSSGDSQSGSLDLIATRLFTDRLSGSIGAGYARSARAITPLGRLAATLLLPFEQVLTVSFNISNAGPQLLVDLRGPLWTGSGSSRLGATPADQLDLAGVLSGRVYQDVDGNGKYEPKVDVAQPEVRVLVDGSYFAVTDRNGLFEIRQLKSGEHAVLLELTSIRADLTILGDPKMTLNLQRGREAVVEYRLAQTGRLRGTVYVDTNGNGTRDEGDEAIADVRVLTGSGKDTLSDPSGDFVIGDLALGKHTVLLDEKTLGDDLEMVSRPFQVLVKPGEEVGGVDFQVKRRERPVEILEFPPAPR